ncbi:unnamed protein product [Ambrosiozyma monospora]|uniref:Unnamed protein product n=1 Tax=Ambrosiozyma monospora TaxID=43982 RepID=A0ACB5T7A5_AMBMO|nr:unnamed protein product [Ambrosiozyma monospora]
MGTGTSHARKKFTTKEKDANEELTQLLVDSVTYAGFTHLDTAEIYTTEPEVGNAVKRCDVDRSKLWITSKYNSGWDVPGGKPGKPTVPSGPYEALQKSLEKLSLSYLDLYLIHFPFFSPENAEITLEEAWKQMERLVEEGKVRNIGVSNFNVSKLEEVLKIAKIKPQVNQIEYNLYLQNQTPGIVKFCKEKDILVEAYSPLTPIIPSKIKEGGPLDPLIDELTAKYRVTKSQLILRWVYQSGVVAVTTSSSKERLKEYTGMTSFEIEEDDFNKLSEVGSTFNFAGFSVIKNLELKFLTHMDSFLPIMK